MAALLGIVFTPPAHAAFPGNNGELVWSTQEPYCKYLVAADPNGAHFRQLTPYDPCYSDANPRWSPDGRWVAFTSNRFRNGVDLVRRDGSGLHALPGRRDGGSVDWSPDGSHLAFVHDSRAGGLLLMVARRDGSHHRTVAEGVGQLGNVRWSPNGRWIIFTEQRGKSDLPDLFVVHPDGTGLRRLTSTPTVEEIPWDWSPDSRWILYLQQGPKIDLYAIRVGDRRIRQITHSPYSSYTEGAATWSPNGKTIAFLRDSSIYFIGAHGGRRHRAKFTNSADEIDWARR